MTSASAPRKNAFTSKVRDTCRQRSQVCHVQFSDSTSRGSTRLLKLAVTRYGLCSVRNLGWAKFLISRLPVTARSMPTRVPRILFRGNLQTVGRCGTLRLDGRASSGSASRTISASWNVSAAAGTNAGAAAAVRDALAPFQGSLLADINATALEVGVEFIFRLSVTNFFGNVDEATATVTRRCGITDISTPPLGTTGARRHSHLDSREEL